MTSGAMLRALREERGLRQEDVAAALGMDRTAISKLEKRKRMQRANAERFGKFYGVPPETLLNPSGQQRDRVEHLEAETTANTASIAALKEAIRLLLGEVVALGGKVPELPRDALPPEAGDIRA